MMLKKHFCAAFSLLIIAGSISIYAQSVNLPTVKIHGKEYYYYKVQKSDSPYGICKKFGWDEQKLRTCNDGFAAKVSKGQTIYYPVSDESFVAEMPEKHKVNVNPQPISHTVARGETVYSIAHLYGVPVDVIYATNPDARHGVRIGEVLTIGQPVFNSFGATSPFYYTIKAGDTLYGLAKTYNTGVEDIMKANPGISEANFQAGKNIRIIPNSRKTHMERQVRDVNTVTGFSSYKVQKNDTWDTIAKANGVDTDVLMKTNSNASELKKGEWVTIPKMQNVVRETYVEIPDVEDSTFHQRAEIYNRVHNISTTPHVNVTVVMSSSNSKSSIDFVRGFIMGVDKQKNAGYKINMNVVDGALGFSDQRTDSVLNASNLIVGIYDSDFPIQLANIGDKNGIEVVNVLDTKNTLYETHPSVVQILQPIDYFNDLAVSRLYQDYSDATLLMVGEIDSSDKFASVMTEQFPAEKTARISLEDFVNYPFSLGEKYVVYSYAQKKDEIEPMLDAIITQKEAGIEIIPVGRAKWVAYAESLSEKFGATNVVVPSRFYNKLDRPEVESFEAKFKSDFNRTPVNSYPQYAMLGYDIANYFLPTTAENGGDYNKGVYYRTGLQNDIDIKRLNTWSGFLNTNAYLLKYLPEGIVEKIEIK